MYFDKNSAFMFQNRDTHSYLGIYFFIYWNIFVDIL